MKASKDSLESLRTQGCAYSSNIWMRNCAPFSLSTDVRGQGKSGCLSKVYGLEIRDKTSNSWFPTLPVWEHESLPLLVEASMPVLMI